MSSKDDVLTSARRFEFVARRIWPRVRRFCLHQLTPRCRRCAISARVPGVELIEGICNKCRASDELRENSGEADSEARDILQQRRELDELLRSYQGRGKGRYDALVILSGGKDSSYLLYRLKSDYAGLRILAATWNSGFYSAVALESARQIARKLDVDHIIYNLSARVFKNLYRYTLTHVNEGGCYTTVDQLDGALNQHMGINLAAQFDIPLLITGLDWAQALIKAGYRHFELPQEHLEGRFDWKRSERKSSTRLADVFPEDDLKLWWDGDRWPKERWPRFIMPFLAWRPDKKIISEELTRLGLVVSGHTSPLITNMEVLPLMAAVDMAKFGYCTFEPEFSDMIRSKETDPIFWRNVFELLEYLVKKRRFLNKGFLSTLKRLDLTPADVGL